MDHWDNLMQSWSLELRANLTRANVQIPLLIAQAAKADLGEWTPE